jgi:molybdopterin-guanine dinucleotide biosynthesis protein A
MDAIILAGGENRRFQSHKALARIEGRTIIEKTLHILRQSFDKIYINTNTPDLFFNLGIPLIGDIVDQRGPMAGMYSSFVHTGCRELFFVACDMPFIKAEVVELIRKRFHGQDAVLAIHQGVPQPLLAAYSENIVPALENRLRQDRRALWDLLTDISVQYVSEQEIAAVDPEGRSFVNINTREEYGNLIVRS